MSIIEHFIIHSSPSAHHSKVVDMDRTTFDETQAPTHGPSRY